ncbi:MAG: acyl carrier protein [Nitrospirae bacterium]|nr:acyl carrier protein [Nitrospirota bacterium]
MDIKEELQEVFRDVFDEEGIVISNEMTASDIDEWDSLSHIQLIVAVEKKFKVKFQTAEIIKLQNVGEFIELLQKKLNK